MSVETNFKVQLREPLDKIEVMGIDLASSKHGVEYYGTENFRIILLKAGTIRDIIATLSDGLLDVNNVEYIEEVIRYKPDWENVR